MSARSPAMSAALPADWQSRLRSNLLRAPGHDPAHCRDAGPIPQPTTAAGAAGLSQPAVTAQPAAVLVPIIDYAEEARLLLTERASHLRQHAGQISFPGGRLEPGDLDLVAAALRETQEEIGIQPAFIQPLGYLPDRFLLSGYRITPVVALLQPGFTLRPDSTEVACTFELPLAVVLDQTYYSSRPGTLRGVEVTIWDMHYADRNIWGATAAVLRDLAAALCGALS